MPRIKSAIKRVRTSAKAQERNYRTRSKVHTAVKQVRDLVTKGEVAAAKEALPRAYQALDLAAKKRVLHKNTVARRKSRLSKLLAKLEQKK